MYRVVRLSDDNGYAMGYEAVVDHTRLVEGQLEAIAPILSEETSSTVRICHGVVTRVYDQDDVQVETRIGFTKSADAQALIDKLSVCVNV